MTRKQNTRLAGLTYLVVVLTGSFSLVYIPSQIIVWESATTTANNILNSEFQFRLGIVSSFICYTSFLILPFILYKLFESVDKTYAILMAILAMVSVPIAFFNVINKLDILSLLSGAQYLNALEPEQIHAQVMLLLKSYNNGILAVQIFWGLWLLPFGYLVFKSNYIPRIFGIFLMIGCISYIAQFSSDILFPDFDMPGFVALPHAIGEIGTCLWLLIMGVKEKPTAQGVD